EVLLEGEGRVETRLVVRAHEDPEAHPVFLVEELHVVLSVGSTRLPAMRQSPGRLGVRLSPRYRGRRLFACPTTARPRPAPTAPSRSSRPHANAASAAIGS